MQHFVNIFKIPAVILMATLLICCQKEGEIIPKKEFSVILSKMYLADQYLESKERLRAKTDTLILYEGIFKAHGYTFEDYRNSLKAYLQDGDAMYKIHMKAKELLADERARIQKQIALTTGLGIDWWALDTIRNRQMNNLWKEPFIRSVKWISMPDKMESWSFTDTTLYDSPHNSIWWENNVKLNITGNNDTLYPILTKDYLIALENNKVKSEKRERREAAMERRAKEKSSNAAKRQKATESHLKNISKKEKR